MGQIGASQLLLRSGASVNLSGPQERTPLMLASSHPGVNFILLESHTHADPKRAKKVFIER